VAPQGKITLIWDSFTAHKDVRIIEVANSLDIDSPGHDGHISATRQEDIWEPEDGGQGKMDTDVPNANDTSPPKPAAMSSDSE
jgi:hypothetical protein